MPRSVSSKAAGFKSPHSKSGFLAFDGAPLPFDEAVEEVRELVLGDHLTVAWQQQRGRRWAWVSAAKRATRAAIIMMGCWGVLGWRGVLLCAGSGSVVGK